MNTIAKSLLIVLGLDAGMSAAWAAPSTTQPSVTPQGSAAHAASPSSSAATAIQGAAAERHAHPCQHPTATERILWPNGNLLWGTRQKVEREAMSSVLVSCDLAGLQLAGAQVKQLKIEGGHLRGTRAGGTAGRGMPLGAGDLVRARLRGTASHGQPVEVAICAAEPAAKDPDMVWYRIEFWNAATEEWENPCATTAKNPMPRALAVQGVWDAQGKRQEAPGRFTFACEEGVIAKCIDWGYKPWQTKGGQSLEDYHQACTRMARADYCGTGLSHTTAGTVIDVYDTVQVQVPEETAQSEMSFEADWTPEGASCVAHTRDGQALETIRDECPERWGDVAEDREAGDRCVLRQQGAKRAAALIRNRSHGKETLMAGGAAAR